MDDTLWQRISAHPLDFLVDKLRAEQRWSESDARAAIGEYRRFCRLAASDPRLAVPSDAVDQVWHLHLTHTRDYWQVFCPQVLRRELHHEPGSAALAASLREQYADTLARYADTFGPPPARWWPGTRERFGARRVSIDLRRHWLLPRPRPTAWLGLGTALGALLFLLPPAALAALPANPLDWPGPSFLILYLALMVLGCVLTRAWRRVLRDGLAPALIAAPLGSAETALLAGGPQRVVDTTVAGMLVDGQLQWDAAGKRLLPAPDEAAAAPDDAIQAGVLEQLRARAGRVPLRPAGRLAAAIEPLGERLCAAGLWLDAPQASRLVWRPLWLALALLLFGAAKLAVGVERHRPVALLVLLMIVTAVGALGMALAAGRRSRAGEAHLAQLQGGLAHTVRAPRSADLALAVALGGTVALSGTAFAGYHERLRAAGGSSGCGSSGGDGGGSGGGSGCGGCSGGG